MTRPSRFLGTATAPPPQLSENTLAEESDMVVILSALLCALICIAGLAAVVRCTCLRRFTGVGGGDSPSPNRGLKKKALQSLPRSTFAAAESSSAASECAICLAEFADGEEIRVLPLCGHSFHVACIDKWLVSRSSCPSCRRNLTPPARCGRCGYGYTAESQVKDHHRHSSQELTCSIPTFLP
ncbi:unnamed protein product [Cochlearia groenlandica]